MYPKARAADLAHFLTLAKSGHPYENPMVIEDLPGRQTPPRLCRGNQIAAEGTVAVTWCGPRARLPLPQAVPMGLPAKPKSVSAAQDPTSS